MKERWTTQIVQDIVSVVGDSPVVHLLFSLASAVLSSLQNIYRNTLPRLRTLHKYKIQAAKRSDHVS